jgi:hypothetical protein
MQRPWIAAFFGVLLAVACILSADERSSPDLPQERLPDQRASVLKPRHLFSMRGRHDPFFNVTGWQSAGSAAFNITGLLFKGLMEVDGQSSALFMNANDRAVYTLRGSQLFGVNDHLIPGVSGRILNEKEVRLRQGELTLNYNAFRSTKRKL